MCGQITKWAVDTRDPRRVRIAFRSTKDVLFTPRGKATGFYANGYIRVNGVTVSGYRYDNGAEYVFYPQGKNEKAVPYTAAA